MILASWDLCARIDWWNNTSILLQIVGDSRQLIGSYCTISYKTTVQVRITVQGIAPCTVTAVQLQGERGGLHIHMRYNRNAYETYNPVFSLNVKGSNTGFMVPFSSRIAKYKYKYKYKQYCTLYQYQYLGPGNSGLLHKSCNSKWSQNLYTKPRSGKRFVRGRAQTATCLTAVERCPSYSRAVILEGRLWNPVFSLQFYGKIPVFPAIFAS